MSHSSNLFLRFEGNAQFYCAKRGSTMIAKPSEIKSAFDKFVRLEAAAAPALAEKIEPAPMPIRARLNYTSVGVCPYCSKPMGRVVCCEQEVFLCESDRFVSPLPNAELPV